jgi:hypothetical protein
MPWSALCRHSLTVSCNVISEGPPDAGTCPSGRAPALPSSAAGKPNTYCDDMNAHSLPPLIWSIFSGLPEN